MTLFIIIAAKMTTLPPSPPLSEPESELCLYPLPERISFSPCNFEYLSESNRKMVKDAYDTISRKELWNAFRNELMFKGVSENIGFMFSRNPVYIRVQNEISSTKIGGLHSGGSLGGVMREMEYIALHGEPEYRRRCLTSNRS